MASVHELKEAIKESLENRGVLSQIKARIRAEVFGALDDQSEPRPALNNENMIINELIREYLNFNRYRYTSSVLVAESGQPKSPLDRQFIKNELNVVEDKETGSVPLLYSIVGHFLHWKARNEHSKSEQDHVTGEILDTSQRGVGLTGSLEHEPMILKGTRK